MNKRKILLLIMIIGLAIVSFIIGRMQKIGPDTETQIEEVDVSTGIDPSDLTDTVIESMKDEAEMNKKYGSYLNSHPIDFMTGEIELTVDTMNTVPKFVVSTLDQENRCFSLFAGDCSCELYIVKDDAYSHTVGADGDNWYHENLNVEEGMSSIQTLFDQTIDAVCLDAAIELLYENPELRYQKTITMGDIELDVFAAVIASNDSSYGEMSEDEYAEYIRQKEEEAAKLLEELEKDEEVLFRIDESEIGSILFYFEAESEKLQYITIYYGTDSVANIIIREQSAYEIPENPDVLEESTDIIKQTSQRFQVLLDSLH